MNTLAIPVVTPLRILLRRVVDVAFATTGSMDTLAGGAFSIVGSTASVEEAF